MENLAGGMLGRVEPRNFEMVKEDGLELGSLSLVEYSSGIPRLRVFMCLYGLFSRGEGLLEGFVARFKVLYG